eukprot:2026057-Pleurochrysis_carterae.AAC.1
MSSPVEAVLRPREHGFACSRMRHPASRPIANAGGFSSGMRYENRRLRYENRRMRYENRTFWKATQVTVVLISFSSAKSHRERWRKSQRKGEAARNVHAAHGNSASSENIAPARGQRRYKAMITIYFATGDPHFSLFGLRSCHSGARARTICDCAMRAGDDSVKHECDFRSRALSMRSDLDWRWRFALELRLRRKQDGRELHR